MQTCRRRGGEAAPTRPGQLVDVGTHHVDVYEAGEASPTVVFVHGAGDCAASWTHLQHQKALPGLSALQAAHRRSCCGTWRNQRSLDRLMSVVAIGWNASVTRSGRSAAACCTDSPPRAGQYAPPTDPARLGDLSGGLAESALQVLVPKVRAGSVRLPRGLAWHRSFRRAVFRGNTSVAPDTRKYRGSPASPGPLRALTSPYAALC
jgi:hypothetical protein